MWRLWLAMIIGGGILAFIGNKERTLASLADEQPQTIALADLIENGYGENAHVTVTDFVGGEFVYEQEEGSSTYKRVWVVVQPMPTPADVDAALAAAGDTATDRQMNDAFVALMDQDDRGLIVRSSELNSEAAINALIDQDTFTGLVVNQIDKLGSQEMAEMKKMVPNAADLMIIDLNRKPKASGGVLAMMGGGIALLLGGIIGMVVKR